MLDTGTSVLAVPTLAFASLFDALRHPLPLSSDAVSDSSFKVAVGDQEAISFGADVLLRPVSPAVESPQEQLADVAQ